MDNGRFKITTEEYTHWVNTGECSEDIIEFIAKTIICQLPLKKYEWNIFYNETARINKKIEEIKDEY